MSRRKAQHGGAREGAGRPPLPEHLRRSRHTVWLTPAERNLVEALGGGSVGAGVRALIESATQRAASTESAKSQ